LRKVNETGGSTPPRTSPRGSGLMRSAQLGGDESPRNRRRRPLRPSRHRDHGELGRQRPRRLVPGRAG